MKRVRLKNWDYQVGGMREETRVFVGDELKMGG
jgi:hypothetical protein